MNVLRVIATTNPAAGGPVEGMRRTAAIHRARGHRTEVACVDPPDAPWLGAEPDLVVHALGPGRHGWAYSDALLPWLRQNASRFDAILVHGLWLYPSFAVWRLHAQSRGAAPPYFVLPHGMLDPWFQKLSVRPVKAIRNIVYWKLVESRVLRDAAAVLFTCEEERRLARLPFRPYRCTERVVAYGTASPPASVDADALPAEIAALDGRPYLLFLSRIHPKKGLDLLLRAYARVFAPRPGEPARPVPALAIAGPCDDPAHLAHLRALADSLGLSSGAPSERTTPRAVWTGMVGGDAKWATFQGCDAFVLPSHQENFGIAVVEAMACAKPVLISDRVNIWREIQEDGAGLVEPDTASGVESLLRRWEAVGADDAQAMGRNAREAFLRRYEIHRAAQSLIDVLGGERE